MINHKNHIIKKLFLGLGAIVFGAILFAPAVAMAVPSDASKNYQYPITDGKCATGDFIEYQSIKPHTDPAKPKPSDGVGPFACIRLTTSKDKGYTTTQLATSVLTSCNDTLGVSGTSSASVPKHLIFGFGWQCIAVTKAARWDTTEYDSVSGPLPACSSKLDTKGDCIVRATDEAAAGKCGTGTIDNQCGLIDKYINPLIKILAGVVGLVVTIMVIVGGIEYTTAGGDPSRVASAKKRIFNALFALVSFILLYAVLNWIIPGGLL